MPKKSSITASKRKKIAQAIAALKACRKGAFLGRPAGVPMSEFLHQGHRF